MKRKGSRFLIGLAAAGLTFGTLMATLGPRHYNHQRHCFSNSYCGEHNQYNHCDNTETETTTPPEAK